MTCIPSVGKQIHYASDYTKLYIIATNLTLNNVHSDNSVPLIDLPVSRYNMHLIPPNSISLLPTKLLKPEDAVAWHFTGVQHDLGIMITNNGRPTQSCPETLTSLWTVPSSQPRVARQWTAAQSNTWWGGDPPKPPPRIHYTVLNPNILSQSFS